MHAKKPQTRLAGGSLAKSLKPNVKKTVKQNTAPKQRSNPAATKSVPIKKLSARKSAKAKHEIEIMEKKSKPLNKIENITATTMESNTSKAANDKKQKSEKKTTIPIVNGEKKATSVKDEKPIKPSKELKNLDIQLCGYSSVVVVARESTGSDSDTDRVIKASICENVKTKARAASTTFNSSGNRSPSVNSPGPNHTKQIETTEKSNKNETALKTPEPKSNNKSSKKKETTKIKSPVKPKTIKSAQNEEKCKKNTNKNKKAEGDKNPNKSQKPKTKSVKMTETPAISTAEKRIEIKTQVNESKSLIDTITEAINEVVKQYQGSNNDDATEAQPNDDNTTTTLKATDTKPLKKNNKIAKTTKKKVLTEKKLEVIESASDLVKDTNNAIKTISKNVKAKQKHAKDNKNDGKICDQIKRGGEKNMEKETAATDSKPSMEEMAKGMEKTSNEKTNKTAAKSKAKPKLGKKSTTSEQTEAKGSKIIKIDLKAKKKVKSLATVKSASLKSAAKHLQNKMIKVLKVCQDDVKKNDEHTSQANPDDMSDDDNLSLTELKAQLTKNDAQKLESNANSSNTNTNTNTSTKLVNAGKNTANKQKATKSSFKKPSNSSNGTATKKKLTNQKESGSTTSTATKSDVYEFHDANFSGDNVPYVHKKKREKVSVTTTANQNNTEKDDVKKCAEKSKTLPPKKQIRHNVLKDASKMIKTDSKSSTTTKTTTKTMSKTSTKALNRSESDGNTEQGDDDNDDKINETKKSAKANNGHKLAAKSRRLKLFGFYSGPKRHRMASLNALAKVQCLYENESRTAQELGFVKEPQNVQRMKIVSDADKNDKNESNSVKNRGKEKEVITSETERKEKKPKKDDDDANIEVERDDFAINNRTLRNVPGLRGEGKLWEMENSSMDESDTDRDRYKMVSYIRVVFSKCDANHFFIKKKN